MKIHRINKQAPARGYLFFLYSYTFDSTLDAREYLNKFHECVRYIIDV